MIRSPFKLLDPYTREDAPVFFGRVEETAQLSDLVERNHLVLVYGPSGVGKTSLVQCGLSNQYTLEEHFPLYIRRQATIPASSNQAIFQALPAWESSPGEGLAFHIAALFRHQQRPIHLIFDQFEELLILGNEEEKVIFTQNLKKLIDAQLPCKIILVLREEYLAQLYDMERMIPHLFENRLRVEPMSMQNIYQVIAQTCQSFNISFDSPEACINSILEQVNTGRSGIQLPYLQLYLDILYREVFKKTYSDGEQTSGEGFPPITLTQEDINAAGSIEDVLANYLQQTVSRVQEQLSGKYPGLTPNAVQSVLDLLVTEEGTKRPLPYDRDEQSGNILLQEPILDALPEIDQPILSDCLNTLEQNRLIRLSENFIELAHDSLAALIDERRTEEQRQLNEVRRMIQSAYQMYEKTGELLTEKQLQYFEEYLPRLNLTSAEEAFIKESYEKAKKTEKRGSFWNRLFGN